MGICKKKVWRCALGITVMLLVLSGCAGKNQQADDSQAVTSVGTAEGAAETDYPLRMTFLDTGKSDCIIMEAGDHVVINDTADADDIELIDDFLKTRQVERIDYLILSHFDKDHIGSAAAILSEYEVGCVLMPVQEKDSEAYLALTEAIDQTGTEERRLTQDYSFTLDNIEFTVDAPEEEFYDDDNNYSLITAVTCGETQFLLMGDALKKRTGEFLDSDMGEERYDLIKMPHHGDYNKKLQELFAIARPGQVVLTAGRERVRVEDKTIALMSKSGCQVYYTDEGTVTALSDGSTVTVIQ